jgi:hypothetical protein
LRRQLRQYANSRWHISTKAIATTTCAKTEHVETCSPTEHFETWSYTETLDDAPAFANAKSALFDAETADEYTWWRKWRV